MVLNALEHEDYPLAAIIEDARCNRDPSRHPLFQVSCTFEKSHRRNETGRAGFLFPDRAEAVEFAGLRQERGSLTRTNNSRITQSIRHWNYFSYWTHG